MPSGSVPVALCPLDPPLQRRPPRAPLTDAVPAPRGENTATTAAVVTLLGTVLAQLCQVERL